MTEAQIKAHDAAEAAYLLSEAKRLLAKYGTTAALKAAYRAHAPGDFWDRVSLKIIQMEQVAGASAPAFKESP